MCAYKLLHTYTIIAAFISQMRTIYVSLHTFAGTWTGGRMCAWLLCILRNLLRWQSFIERHDQIKMAIYNGLYPVCLSPRCHRLRTKTSEMLSAKRQPWKERSSEEKSMECSSPRRGWKMTERTQQPSAIKTKCHLMMWRDIEKWIHHIK